MTPPKPKSRPDSVGLWRYLRLFRQDILSAQPERLYRAWMAEFRTPFFRSYLVNQPELVKTILEDRARDFPKSNRISEGLRPLLGNSVFLTNGADWERQRRIIDPAFERGRIKDSFPAVLAAGQAAATRLGQEQGVLDTEAFASHMAADVIFRTLFSIPITDAIAERTYVEFRRYQRAQPLLNPAAFLPVPRWFPRIHKRDVRQSAQRIRALIRTLTDQRAAEIESGTAPSDLATRIMTEPDPQTGKRFSTEEMVDQVAIFFLAGHETSASALAWAFYLLASHPKAQDRVRAEAARLPDTPDFADLSKLAFTRNVFRETLRLYPPVPMMVRETTRPERFRDRDIPVGAQLVLSPWHMHRHNRIWTQEDAFDPDRFTAESDRAAVRSAYLPFSSGRRVCPGAGFAMMEGTVLLALLVRAFRFTLATERPPVPVAFLTVRSQSGIFLKVTPRDPGDPDNR